MLKPRDDDVITVEVVLIDHAKERFAEGGAVDDEVVATVRAGERFAAKYGRIGYRRNFAFGATRAWAAFT